jgi:AcrR family transcriptional regulator
VARPKSDIQERILDAAHRRFLAEGVDAASLRSIAKDADTSIGMVYYYYTTKDELFLAVVEETYQLLLADLDEVFQTHQSFRERLTGLYERVGKFSTYELEVIELIIRESLTSNERRNSLIRRFKRGHLPLLWNAVADGRKTGELEASIHPIVIMACSVAIGTVPMLMLRNVNRQCDASEAEGGALCDWQESACSFLETLPEKEALPQILCDVAMRALSAASVLGRGGEAPKD